MEVHCSLFRGMTTCCPAPCSSSPPYPGYAWRDKGVEEQVGVMSVYRVGVSSRCVIWCYDIYGFHGGRTRELCDKLADCGYMVIMPDFFRGESRDVTSPDLGEWLKLQSDWLGHRQSDWVETVLPYARSHGAEIFGVAGTCWGGYMVLRLSSYGEFKAGASFHPATSYVVETLLKQKLYEILDEVQCPQLVLTAGEDSENEKPGGLASRVWNVTPIGPQCEIREFPDMEHGWTTRGDIRQPAVENCARAAFNSLKGFFDNHIRERN